MRTLVISDIHLTHKFDSRKFEFLARLISRYENVIIAGDFWSAYTCKFDRFVKSKWSGLFPLLKDRKTVYLYGNHDRKRWCDDRVYQFCDIARRDYTLEKGDVHYHILHGVEYLVDSINNELFMTLHRSLKAYRLTLALDKFILKRLGYDGYTDVGSRFNEVQRFEIGDDERFTIVGHTHSPQGSNKLKYFNTGFINYGYASYVVITDKGAKLFKERY